MKASVIGATGFAGAELLRLLDGHPEVELAAITSESSTGESIAAMYPHLSARIETSLGSMQELEQIADQSDVIFIALPHGHAMKIGRQLKKRAVKIIDLGGDYRFKDVRVFEEWYKVKHEDPETQAVYGLTELYRDQVKAARILANPGCYTTCSILALVPLLKAGLIEPRGIVVDAKSGTTGAGRGLKLGSLYCSVNENFHAYGVASHRHTPEIEQVYSEYAGEDVVIQFTPHLLPVDRGILATCYASLKAGVSEVQVQEAFAAMYGDEYFIRLRGQGACPEIKNVRASNYVDIGWQMDRRTGRIIVMSALDNLVKGAAGQAVQNMNVMFGIPENTGLTQLPIYP
ncbi:N-acetyl-gamma-glutamyl-phosphate reductase [uncultured Phascolarctobacterium sp.]|uniref:N-acetyl-gamma-glutamyl-phosphate reductase n=1 Tax=uncultured Phascolarctobacterium sp. TaxID=512296 RepID=UPI0025DB24B1|nr:N-acetyl-gamma-glutamyl-phosphate reductase [uncultured Phascolarctobacterium sp.]